jgi:hypothetical protein
VSWVLLPPMLQVCSTPGEHWDTGMWPASAEVNVEVLYLTHYAGMLSGSAVGAVSQWHIYLQFWHS